MATQQITSNSSNWEKAEEGIFRFFFLYFLLQLLPIDGKFWQHLFSTNWLNLQFRDIFYLTRYQPQFVPGGPSFANWAIIAVLALIGTAVWSRRSPVLSNRDELYYWLRVALRYRLAIGVIAYGILKFFPLQAPAPSLSNLNTPYGDFSDWKIFSLSLGVVAGYQSFLGLVEILGGALLLYRKTATIGTLIILPFTGNVFFSNLAYNGGEYVYSAYLIAIALYLFAFDGLRLFSLLSLERPTAPNVFKPIFPGWQKTGRLVAKTAFVLFLVGYGLLTRSAFQQDGQYHFPRTSGLKDSEGVYNVAQFKLNGKELPYSKTNPQRWQDVIFEKWNTVSIKSSRPVKVVHAQTEEIHPLDAQRNYEYAGAQGRHYYSYEVQDGQEKLVLNNRNPNHPAEKLELSISRPNTSTIILQGINENQDSVYAVLNKLDKRYLIFEAQKTGRRRGLTL